MRKINTGRVGLDSPAQTPEGKKGAGGGCMGRGISQPGSNGGKPSHVSWGEGRDGDAHHDEWYLPPIAKDGGRHARNTDENNG